MRDRFCLWIEVFPRNGFKRVRGVDHDEPPSVIVLKKELAVSGRAKPGINLSLLRNAVGLAQKAIASGLDRIFDLAPRCVWVQPPELRSELGSALAFEIGA
jgi:hypothetical protein